MHFPQVGHGADQSGARRQRLAQTWQHLWHIAAVILGPLLLLAAISAGTLGLIALVRVWTAGDAFFVRQLSLLLVVTLGLMLAVLSYTITIVFALRKIRAWHESNQTRKALGATWGLGFTALVILLPLLALFLQ
ncbi:MAG TPA: hypothetical protein VFQ30_02485 [Ktedonobacteraceae bacterium]|nr:hypothetical protein [Ktedonobacteraceae bacterium]